MEKKKIILKIIRIRIIKIIVINVVRMLDLEVMVNAVVNKDCVVKAMTTVLKKMVVNRNLENVNQIIRIRIRIRIMMVNMERVLDLAQRMNVVVSKDGVVPLKNTVQLKRDVNLNFWKMLGYSRHTRK